MQPNLKLHLMVMMEQVAFKAGLRCFRGFEGISGMNNGGKYACKLERFRLPASANIPDRQRTSWKSRLV